LRNRRRDQHKNVKGFPAGSKELAGLKEVEFLSLCGTQMTKEGVADLQKTLPKCKIKSPFFAL
jgi:hypothetical protein